MRDSSPPPGWYRVPVAYCALEVCPDGCEAEGKQVYALEWRNPHRYDGVAEVTLKTTRASSLIELSSLVASRLWLCPVARRP